MLISSSKSRCWERCGAVLVHRFLCEGNNGMNYNSRKLFSVAVVIAPLPAWHSAGETYKSAGVFPDLNVRKKVKLDETWGETSDCLILTRRSQEKHVDVGNILNTSSPSFYLHGSRKGIFIKRSNMIINNTNISISTLLISLKIFKTAHPHSSMTLEITWRWSGGHRWIFISSLSQDHTVGGRPVWMKGRLQNQHSEEESGHYSETCNTVCVNQAGCCPTKKQHIINIHISIVTLNINTRAYIHTK